MFITLTHADKRALINVEHIVAIVQELGGVSIVDRIEQGRRVVQRFGD